MKIELTCFGAALAGCCVKGGNKNKQLQHWNYSNPLGIGKWFIKV